MTTSTKIGVKHPVGALEIRRLVYTKYLLTQARQFLQNRLVEAHYNLAVVLSANATELFCHLMVMSRVLCKSIRAILPVVV